MKPLSPARFGKSSSGVRRAFVFVIRMAAAISLAPAAIASDELIAISDFFGIKKVSGGVGVYKWEGNEIYVRLPGKDPEYIGTSAGGPPRGMGPLTDATQDLRAITVAISKDGRSLVFRHRPQGARSGSSLEGGIYQYVHGTGMKILHGENELSGLSYSRWVKAFPPGVLPFTYKPTYTPKDLLWAVNAGGERFPLALFEATTLHWAAFEGRTDDCTALIRSGTDVNAKTYWDFTPLDLAIIRDYQDTAVQLLALGADRNAGIYPAFHRAVMLVRMKAMQAMLDRGADVNASDEHGYTPLHMAVFAGARKVGELGRFFDNAETPRSIMEKNMTTKLVQILLDKGADPGIRDKYGKTPLDAISNITPMEVKELLSERSRAR